MTGQLASVGPNAARMATRLLSALTAILRWPFHWIYRPVAPAIEGSEANRPTTMEIFHGVDLVAVAPSGGDAHDAEVFDLLQINRRSKMLDLRPAAELTVGWFERLSSSWPRPRDATRRRLAVVLDYDRWALWAPTIEQVLAPLDDCGVDVEVFYTQQTHRLDDWFANGVMWHNLPAVLAWIRHDWPMARAQSERALTPPPTVGSWIAAGSDLEGWAIVLRRTAMLVEDLSTSAEVPELRIELAHIAWTFGGPGGEREVRHHLSRALHWIGDSPNQSKCRVLRSIAALELECQELASAFARLDRAAEIAMAVHDVEEAVLALAEYGIAALRWRLYARAEARLCRALAYKPRHMSKELRANMYHWLARAMLGQGKADAETLGIAQQALFSRSETLGEAAEQDRALLALISARMADALGRLPEIRHGE